MAQDTAVPKLSFQYWLDKAVEWGQTTTLESQQDVCLHLPKLQEFLQQIYESLKHMVSNLTGRMNCFEDCLKQSEPHVPTKPESEW